MCIRGYKLQDEKLDENINVKWIDSGALVKNKWKKWTLVMEIFRNTIKKIARDQKYK